MKSSVHLFQEGLLHLLLMAGKRSTPGEASMGLGKTW